MSTQHERVTVTVHGGASAVLLAPEDLERLEETIAVLADSDLLRQLAEADADVAAGRVETADDLAEATPQDHGVSSERPYLGPDSIAGGWRRGCAG